MPNNKETWKRIEDKLKNNLPEAKPVHRRSVYSLLDDAAHSIKTDKEIMDNYCAECTGFTGCYYSSAIPHIHQQIICKKSLNVHGYFLRVRWNEFLKEFFLAFYKLLPEWIKRVVRRFI